MAPRILRTNPAQESYLAYGSTESTLGVYLDEPAECRYGLDETATFEELPRNFACDSPFHTKIEYSCLTSLESLLTPENKIYIRCKDNSSNILDDYTYTLYITENELQIDSIIVSYDGRAIASGGLITENFEPIPVDLNVETSEGAYSGESVCSYKWLGNWIPFIDTGSIIHNQPGINLVSGETILEIRCRDNSGNIALDNITFNIEIDADYPIVVRAYKEGSKLKIITDEKAKCYYDNEDCRFAYENATKMEVGVSTSHSADWDTDQTYYIKCEDIFGNKPDECTIKVRPSQT